MRELKVVDDEAGGVRIAFSRWPDALAEESQFISEPMAVRVENVAGKIPPLRLEFPMTAVIPWDFIAPAGLRRFPIGGGKKESEDYISCSSGPVGRSRSTEQRNPLSRFPQGSGYRKRITHRANYPPIPPGWPARRGQPPP